MEQRGAERGREKERHRCERPTLTSIPNGVPLGNACKVTSISSVYLSCIFLSSRSMVLVRQHALHCPRRANAFIFGHWSQSLANELTAGCENLTWSTPRPRPAASPPLHGVFQPGPVSGQRRDSSEVPLPACSMIIEAAGSPGGLLARTHMEKSVLVGRALYLRDRSTSTDGILTYDRFRLPQVQPQGNRGACPRCIATAWHFLLEGWKNDGKSYNGEKRRERMGERVGFSDKTRDREVLGRLVT